MKLLFLIAAQMNLKINTSDVKAAFLQGTSLDRDVFLKPPLERRVPGVVWKMVKRAYGFVDASRGFYLELEKTLKDLGCVVSRHDPALFLYFVDQKLTGVIMSHVDDLLHGSGDETFEDEVMIPLKKKFQFGSEEEEAFRFVGMNIAQSKDSIRVDLSQFAESLDSYQLENVNGNPDSLLMEGDQDQFKSMVGKIGWLAKNARPDLSFDSVVLSSKAGKATVSDFNYTVKILKKIKADDTEMIFRNLGSISEWSLEGHSDAGYRSLPDKISSCGGQVVLVVNRKRGRCCVLEWKSKKIRRVVSSSTAAEAIALNDALDEIIYLKEVLIEVVGEDAKDVPIELYTDCRNLQRSILSTTLAENPRLRTEIAKLQESLEKGEVERIHLVPGQDMIANCLTKKGASSQRLRGLLKEGISP